MDDAGDDSTHDATDGGLWMSYAALAALRGIDKASATRLAFRRGWRRMMGNDGKARVLVPASAQTQDQPDTPDAPHDSPNDATVSTTGDVSSVVSAMEAHLESLRSRLTASEGETAGLRDRIASMELELAALRQAKVDALVRAASAEGETKALREALREAQRPFWHRWIGRP